MPITADRPEPRALLPATGTPAGTGALAAGMTVKAPARRAPARHWATETGGRVTDDNVPDDCAVGTSAPDARAPGRTGTPAGTAPAQPAVPLPLWRPARLWRPVSGPGWGPLPELLLALTLVTGLVDAVSILALGRVFVANMTGNVVFAGFALVGAAGFSLAASLFGLAGFMIGAGAGGRLVGRFGSDRGRLLAIAVAVESVLFG